MKKTLLCAIVFAVSAGAAFADEVTCTAEDLQAKSTELASALQALAASDPQRMQEISQEMTKAQASGKVSDQCAFFDELIAKASS